MSGSSRVPDPSVAVVVLDTMRADRFRRDFDWLPGRRFTRAYSTSHWTVPAHASMLCGRYASELGVTAKGRSLDCPESTLFEQLQEAGYDTRLWTENLQIYQPDGWDRGVDEVVGPQQLDPRNAELFDWAGAVAETQDDGPTRYPKLVWQCLRSEAPTLRSLRAGVELFRESAGATGAPGVESVLRRIGETEVTSPTFLLVNIMEMHTPYWPAEPYRVTDEPLTTGLGASFSGTAPERSLVAEAYDACSRYLADRYRELFDRLSDEFDYVITCSDHGELLGEYGMYNHGYGLYEELVHVPLVVSGPDVETGTCDEPVSLLDVYETIRSLADVGEPRRGRSLLEPLEPRAHLTEYHGFLPWHRDQLARHGVPDGVYDAYDTPRSGLVAADGRYGWETHLHLAGGTETGFTGDPRLRTDLAEHRTALSVRAVAETEKEEDVDDAVRSRLEDLGYA